MDCPRTPPLPSPRLARPERGPAPQPPRPHAFAALLRRHGAPSVAGPPPAERRAGPAGEAPAGSTSGKAPPERAAGAGDKEEARDDGEATTRARRRPTAAEELDALDPAVRHTAQLAPPLLLPAAPVAGSPEAEATSRARSLEELVPELVRRIAWAGDARRGSVRLELGAGAFAGASVVVHADEGRVRVEVGGLPEPTLAPLRARLEARLRGRGIALEGIT